MKKSILFLAFIAVCNVFAQEREDSLLSLLRLDEVVVSAPVMQVNNSKEELDYQTLNYDRICRICWCPRHPW